MTCFRLLVACAALALTSPGQIPSYKELKFPALRQPAIPNPETFTLPNGMKVYLLENHELPVVRGTALVKIGNLFDPADKHGLAELTGTVLRSGGTQKLTGDQIDETLENIAASIESSVGEESGSIRFSCLKENSGEVLALFRDFLSSAEFRQEKLDLALTQVRSGIARRNDDPDGVANREFQAIVYGRDNPYGWQVEYEHLNNIKRDDLVAFYQRYFFPANVTLSVYGDFSTPQMKAQLEALFADWTYQQPPVPPFPAFHKQTTPGIFVAEKSDVTQTFFEIGHVAGVLREKDYPALEVAANILGNGFSSRLMQKVRTELGYAYSIGATWGAGYLHPGLFDISGSTKSGSTTETIEVIRKELDKMRTGEVTDAELKNAKDTVLNSFVFFFDTPAKTLNRLVTYDYYGYPRDFIFQYQKAVAAVTKADVLRVAKAYFKPEDLTIVACGNPKDFGKPLSSLGLPLKTLDLTIPEPKRAEVKADASTLKQGTELLRRAQLALGGTEKLAAIKDLTRVVDASVDAGGNSMKVKQTTRIVEPSAFRQDQELPFGKLSVYSDGKSGWMAAPQGSQPLPAPVLKQVRAEMARQFQHLLLSSSANLVGKGTIEIEGVRVTIDEGSGLPSKVVYQSDELTGTPAQVEESYFDWREVGGVKFPYKAVIEQGGKKFAEMLTTDLKINTGLKAEELSKK